MSRWRSREPTGKIGAMRSSTSTILVLAVAVGGGGSTKKHATTQSTGEPLPALQAGGYRLNQLDPPKQFPLDRMRLSLRDLLVIGPPLLAKKERQSLPHRPEQEDLNMSSMKPQRCCLTSNAVDVDEGDYCRLTIEGTSFPYFPSSTGT
ncbi:hypothetical protein QYF36_005290 [Acer negundo]|nr:hypothetical protein QYF36_005290 [Acer negundo]